MGPIEAATIQRRRELREKFFAIPKGQPAGNPLVPAESAPSVNNGVSRETETESMPASRMEAALIEQERREQNLLRLISALQEKNERLTTILNRVLPEESPDQPRPTIGEIGRIVAEHYGLTYDELCNGGRAVRIARPRWLAFYLCRTMTLRSFPKIGLTIGGMDHTTVMHGFNKIQEAVTRGDAVIVGAIEELQAKVRQAVEKRMEMGA